jgi:hypothetical protein
MTRWWCWGKYHVRTAVSRRCHGNLLRSRKCWWSQRDLNPCFNHDHVFAKCSNALKDFDLRTYRHDLNTQDEINGTRKIWCTGFMKYETTNGVMEDYNRQQQPKILSSLVVCCCLPINGFSILNRAQNRNVKSVLARSTP